MHAYRRSMIWLLPPLLAACASACYAQAGDCTANVKIKQMGVPLIADNKRSMLQSVSHAHYRIEATSDEKQCVFATFNIMLRFTDKDGKPGLETYPGSIRFRGGQGAESGELPGRRQDSRFQATIEDIICKRC